MTLSLRVFVEPTGKSPLRGKDADVGVDVYADLASLGLDTLEVSQGDVIKVPLGFRYAFWENDEPALSPKYWIDVRNRSGVGVKSGLVTVAEIGDSNYRGILHYCAAKVSPGKYTIEHGDKIAQLIISVPEIKILIVSSIEELGTTERGDKGFGGSGK